VEQIRKINPAATVGAFQADMWARLLWACLSTPLTQSPGIRSASVEIGAITLKSAADIFARGDKSSLRIHIIVHNAAIVVDNTLEAETIENFNTVFNTNG